MNDLFVYGTLMAGEPQGGLLKRFAREEASVPGRLYRLPQGYPALQPAQVGQGSRVFGELVRGVDPRLIPVLDQYEGVAEGLYRRIRVDVTSGLRTWPAWAWVMDDPPARGGVRIPKGRWRGAIRR